MLTFKPSKNQKGLCAKNVVLEKGKQPKQNNNIFDKPQKNYKHNNSNQPQKQQVQPKKKNLL